MDFTLALSLEDLNLVSAGRLEVRAFSFRLVMVFCFVKARGARHFQQNFAYPPDHYFHPKNSHFSCVVSISLYFLLCLNGLEALLCSRQRSQQKEQVQNMIFHLGY